MEDILVKWRHNVKIQILINLLAKAKQKFVCDAFTLYVRVKYREGGIYGVYSPRGHAASEDCIRHKSHLSRYLTNLFYFWGGFLVESFDFKQFKSKVVETFPQVWSIWDTARGTSKKTDTKIK